MTSARPGRLQLGDRIRFQERTYTVVGLTGMQVRLADTHGVGMLVDQVHLQSAGDFSVLSAGDRAALGPAALLEHLSRPVAERALWWQRHLVEILTGLPPDAPVGARPKSEYERLSWPRWARRSPHGPSNASASTTRPAGSRRWWTAGSPRMPRCWAGQIRVW